MNREYFYPVLPKFSCYSVAPTLPFLFSHFSCICPGPMGAPDLCSVSVCVCMHVSHVVHISRKVRTAELEKRKSGRKSLKVNYFFYFKKRYTQTTHTHAHTQASCTCHINKQSNICKLTAWACCPLLCSTPFSPPENSFTEHVCVCVCVCLAQWMKLHALWTQSLPLYRSQPLLHPLTVLVGVSHYSAACSSSCS